jgi:threonine dehydratase
MSSSSSTMSPSLNHTTAITLADILAARGRIASSVYYTPCTRSEMLSRMSGQSVFLKLENLQMTGSFKERGALNKIATLTPEQGARGVVAASAGNHAQGVAYHATQRGIRSVIVMPLTTPLVKVTATRNFGAEVVLHGGNYDEACTEASRLCEAEGMTFIHPFDDPLVMAGQGTIGLELLEQVDGLEAVVVPIGGGGLIGGIACAVKESRPGVRVIGVQTSRLPSMLEAVKAHHPVTLEPGTTIADGIAVRRAGDVTFPVVNRYVDEIVTVDEDEIASAILTLLEREKTLAEGAGATALAAVLQQRTRARLSWSAAATSMSPC